jgi:hypothetical protein
MTVVGFLEGLSERMEEAPPVSIILNIMNMEQDCP